MASALIVDMGIGFVKQIGQNRQKMFFAKKKLPSIGSRKICLKSQQLAPESTKTTTF